MKKLNIFLADLTHTYKALANPFMPYGIGLIASYAKKMFGDAIEVKLFKYPEKLYEALNQEHCDILGCSTYVWNSNLAHWACRTAKRKNSNVITVLGGPDFAKDYDKKLEYFKKCDYVDIRILLEGEIAFSNLIKLILKHGIVNKDKIFKDKIEGCSFLHKNKTSLVEVHTERIQLLDEIPSPYTTGLLDEFFDGKLIPVIQTTRGCPFSCNFCVESDKYYSRIKNFQTQYAIDELDYIGKKISKTPTVTNLQIADSNYGMYKRDKIISEKILELQENYNWPQGIYVSTGKHFKNVIDTTEMLMDTFDFSMSVQSMDAAVLEEIGRKNISTEKYKEAGIMLRNKGRSTLAETIVPLPKETLKSFFKGFMELMDCKVSRISSTTTMFLNGTSYKDKKYVDKFGYISKFRLINGQFGIYGGEKVFEFEEVGVATNTLNFDEYLETRKFSILVEMLYNSKIFREVEFFIEDLQLNYFQYVYTVYNELKNAPQDIKNIMQSVVNQSINELKDNEESLINYYNEERNFQKVMNGEEGENVKYTHKALLLSKYQNVWLEFAFSCLKKFLTNNNVQIKEDFNDLVSFVKCKLDGVLDHSRSSVSFINSFNYDIIKWLDQENRTKTLKEFNDKDKTKIKFVYDKDQIKERDTLFDKYKYKDAFSVTNILVSIRPQHKIYRKYTNIEQNT
tara:strand:+ start:412 stop:2454 length:2043 start_codon:yes stop_codon:yes gene_type:complete